MYQRTRDGGPATRARTHAPSPHTTQPRQYRHVTTTSPPRHHPPRRPVPTRHSRVHPTANSSFAISMTRVLSVSMRLRVGMYGRSTASRTVSAAMYWLCSQKKASYMPSGPLRRASSLNDSVECTLLECTAPLGDDALDEHTHQTCWHVELVLRRVRVVRLGCGCCGGATIWAWLSEGRLCVLSSALSIRI